MRLAFVAYEFPPDTGGGGIGTYLVQVTRHLAQRGHDVHVFAGTPAGANRVEHPLPGLTVHRVPCAASPGFRTAVVAPFLAEHARAAFAALEAADFDAPALELQRRLPDLPCVVKLHTPRFAVDELNLVPAPLLQCWRIHLGAWRRGRLHRPEPIRAQPNARAELESLRAAHLLSAPSRAIAAAAAAWLPEPRPPIEILPLPYEPAPALLRIPPRSAGLRVTFLGRLEERKGVVDLADAVGAVLARVPAARFRLVGRSMPSGRGPTMQTFLERRLGRARHAVEFTGPLPPAELPRLLEETAILAVPSHWESFGLVCCEGMAAARPVVGGARGGMAEILDRGAGGVLVEPRQPAALAAALVRLLESPAERERLGLAGRERVLREFGLARIADGQLASYQRAIEISARPASA